MQILFCLIVFIRICRGANHFDTHLSERKKYDKFSFSGQLYLYSTHTSSPEASYLCILKNINNIPAMMRKEGAFGH
jgi:hypothetical protein